MMETTAYDKVINGIPYQGRITPWSVRGRYMACFSPHGTMYRNKPLTFSPPGTWSCGETVSMQWAAMDDYGNLFAVEYPQ